MTATVHTQVVQKQFGEQASAYLSSAVHAQGTEFALLQAELVGQGAARLLDLGCGAGHVSFNMAPLVKEVVAYDLSQQMLDVVATAAVDRGFENIRTVQGAAERLPFADGEFDFVFSRYSAHHWSDLRLALREVRRVLKPGGVVAFVDVLSPGSPLLDTYLQTAEVLRDTSHVRDYSAAEWMQQLSETGLHVRNSSRQRLRLEYTSWVERMRTPEVLRAAILELQQAMGQEVRDYYEIQADGTFSTDVLVVFAER
ncbi:MULTISPECIES: class I SAM-dependent methyltransferase [Pseudomonas]|uniref:Methyltransferase n=2 Tax=Pseudomonas fluorescens TaxID=294 RepID=C3JZT8_PSEFS|nr:MULTISPECIES: class I SAM-dependent methyltransferase [Pseudomonas]MBZ6457316.1 class I SAM-dependent methyltransferase [Pseudomonas fluorescens group sp.]MBZ6462573.1 class I SAM-dependent methyltransferase [Pseudomonas fluorescens group sp.]MBZ6470968.1 class I SAM-dependent methyltransferase [Pseudomonas fluorescens group sp.]WQD70523.1 class I SAM-dependent methyltransferase [Pseudomonas marginalis]CAI2798386.1 Putative methyltransferase [Pseudomonas fluorescens SBW25]